MPTTESIAPAADSTRSGWPYNATFPALERLHAWISPEPAVQPVVEPAAEPVAAAAPDVHIRPAVGRHRAVKPPKVSLATRLRAAVSAR